MVQATPVVIATTMTSRLVTALSIASATVTITDGLLKFFNPDNTAKELQKSQEVTNSFLKDINGGFSSEQREYLDYTKQMGQILNYYSNKNIPASYKYGQDVFGVKSSGYNYSNNVGIQNNDDLKSLYEVVRDGFILNNDLLALIANPKNPFLVFDKVQNINETRTAIQKNIESNSNREVTAYNIWKEQDKQDEIKIKEVKMNGIEF